MKAAWVPYALFLSLPLWWALGVDLFIWPILALPLAWMLLRQRKALRIPKGFYLFALFLLWVFLSSIMLLDDPTIRWLGWAWRFSLYLSAAVLWLYFYQGGTALARPLTVALTAYWIFVALGGLLALEFPTFSFTSPVASLVPQGLAENRFIQDGVIHRHLAGISYFLGYPVPRPATGFPYTNRWGSTYALLIPFVVLAYLSAKRLWQKGIIAGLLGLSAFPLVFSLNRGAWLSLGVLVLYASIRALRKRRWEMLWGAGLLTLMLGGMVLLTPLKGLVLDRMKTPHSNAFRESLYQQAIQGALESPILGNGAPQKRWKDKPSVGTHGQIWLVLFSQGFIGLLLFLGWMLHLFWSTRHGGTPFGFWVHALLLMGMLQMFFYELTGTGFSILMAASAIALREHGSLAQGGPLSSA